MRILFAAVLLGCGLAPFALEGAQEQTRQVAQSTSTSWQLEDGRWATVTWEGPSEIHLDPTGSVRSIGGGCAIRGVMPVLRCEIPRRGELQRVELQWRGWWAGLPSVLLIGTSADSWGPIPLPLNLGFLGSPTCHLRTSVDVTLAFPLSDPVVHLPIGPRWPAEFYLQALVFASDDGAVILSQCAHLTVRGQ